MGRIETLEERLVLASQVASFFENGNLTLTGSGFSDDLIVTITGNSVELTSTGNVTSFTGDGDGPFLVTRNLIISLGNGGDFLSFVGAAGLIGGSLFVDLGADGDFIMPQTGDLTFAGDVTVSGGTGDDLLELGFTGAPFAARNITIDSGPGVFEFVYLDAVTTTGNVSITNSGTGAQLADLGLLAANSIGGNLTITQSNPNNTGGYAADIFDTTVVGNLTVTNGDGDGDAVIQLVSTGPRTVGGTTTLTNGDNLTNTVTITGATLKLTKSITVKNGISTDTNEITVNGLLDSGSSAATFTNGDGDSNSITFGDTASNNFLGSLTLTNGDADAITNATSNSIALDQTTVAKTASFTNGSANDTNSVTIGANTGVTLSANIVIKNGEESTSNTVTISRLSAGGGVLPPGNVTIINAASDAIEVTLGGDGANTIAGNLVITNLTTTGDREIEIDDTIISGRTGLSITESAAGNSTLTIGATTSVTISGQLNIQDGTGTSTLNLRGLTAGSLTYNDLGGGSDTIQIASAGAGTVQVGGVTRINLGNGSDTVTIATAGTAIFSNSVIVTLGAGNDDVVIGGSASSPAFSSANRYQFDGGTGFDTFTADTMSLADYSAPVLPRKLRSKIAGFESLA